MYLENEYVINQGEDAEEMFIIFKGEVLVFLEEKIKHSAQAMTALMNW